MLIGTFDPTSTSATWSESNEIVDDETGEAIDLSDVDEITVVIRDPKTKTIMQSATLTGSTVVIVETGVFQWEFSDDQMGALDPKTYDIGCVLEKDGQKIQYLIGRLPVLDGIVS
jgi:hypothetical protein